MIVLIVVVRPNAELKTVWPSLEYFALCTRPLIDFFITEIATAFHTLHFLTASTTKKIKVKTKITTSTQTLLLEEELTDSRTTLYAPRFLLCSSPGVGNLRPAPFYCHPARDLLSFFNDRYAAINRWNDSHLFFLVFAINSAKKRHELLAKTFFLVFATDSRKKRPEFLAKTFLFWSAGMVAARWNLVRTKCGPLVQKVADLCSIVDDVTQHQNIKKTATAVTNIQASKKI